MHIVNIKSLGAASSQIRDVSATGPNLKKINTALKFRQIETLILYMEPVEVFRFKIFHQPSGEYVVPPQWATINAIELTQGLPILETGKTVSTADLDSQGFYRPSSRTGRN